MCSPPPPPPKQIRISCFPKRSFLKWLRGEQQHHISPIHNLRKCMYIEICTYKRIFQKKSPMEPAVFTHNQKHQRNTLALLSSAYSSVLHSLAVPSLYGTVFWTPSSRLTQIQLCFNLHIQLCTASLFCVHYISYVLSILPWYAFTSHFSLSGDAYVLGSYYIY